jgi:hypothetical protein
VKEIQVCSNKGLGPLQKEKMGQGHLKMFFSRTTGSSLIRLSTNHLWGKGIQVCSNEGDSPSPRGDDSKRVKLH